MIDGPRVEKQKKLRILVAPLDWGLGHATRCIPVIYELLRQDVEVWLAGEGAQEILLKAEFPEIPILPLEGYRIKYGSGPGGLLRALLFQTPRMLRRIGGEQQWLLETVKNHAFDAVISDNRFGLYHPSIPTVFVTHQLQVRSPLGKWSTAIARRINYRFINRFTECWVPDDQHQFAGELSHPRILPRVPVFYIGVLSRLTKDTGNVRPQHIMISLSGPEPQRSLLENMVVDELVRYPGTATVLRGLPGSLTHIPGTNDLVFLNHLPASDLAKEMQQAEYIICRSGYSTVMDVISLGKKAIFIPTPGQTEQEYLAKYLTEKGIGCFVKQSSFSLRGALKKAREFEYKPVSPRSENPLPEFIHSFLQRVKQAHHVKTNEA